VTDPVAVAAATLAGRLPAGEIGVLAAACAVSSDGLLRLKMRSPSGAVRGACDELSALIAAGHQATKVSGALLGAQAAVANERDRQQVDAVWTGPSSSVRTSRLTSAVVVDLIAAARTEILLVSYATQTEPHVDDALRVTVAEQGVDVTLLLERSVDNPRYTGRAEPFPGLPALRLSWPASRRESSSASMHAKLLVIDRAIALVGSANVTGHALAHNLECGLLVTGGPVPRMLHDHVDSLRERGHLVRV